MNSEASIGLRDKNQPLQLLPLPIHHPLSTINLFPLSPDSVPQLSLGTAVLIIFAACAGFLLVRGMTRMIVGTIVLGLSAWLGFLVWQRAPTLSVDWTGKSLTWLTNGLPVAAFLTTFFVIRKITSLIARPFGKPQENAKPRSFIATGFRLLLALIPTSLICIIGAALVYHNGSVAEVRAYSEKSTGKKTATNSYSQRLKSAVEATLPASWLAALDPLSQPARINLAKLIAAQAESPHKPVIDPKTGKPIPRAIIVDDPALQNLAREGKFDTLLRHPLLTKALADPKIQKLLRGLSL